MSDVYSDKEKGRYLRISAKCNCEICGTRIETWARGRKTTCSEECRIALMKRTKKARFMSTGKKKFDKNSARLPLLYICEICGKMFMHNRLKTRKTCSEECHNKLRQNSMLKRWGEKESILSQTINCVICGSKMKRTYSNRKTCSGACRYALSMRTRGVPAYKGAGEVLPVK